MKTRWMAMILIVPSAGMLAAGCASRAFAPAYSARKAVASADEIEFAAAPVGRSGGEPAGAPAAPSADPARTDRLVVYSGTVNVVVRDINDSIRRVGDMAANLGGHMQDMTQNSITVKVPANRFQEAIAAVEKLGEVARKEVRGEDVTEEMRDLRIRLQNAENVRDRLTKLLDKCDKMEDALKVEKELERITQDVELLKGKIQFLQANVAFSTLTVYFNSPLLQRQVAIEQPFAWVRDLATELGVGGRVEVSPDTSWLDRVCFDLPKGYLKASERNYVTRAMSADGVSLKVYRVDNYEGGVAGFWGKLVRRELVEHKAISLSEESTLKVRRGVDVAVMSGTKEVSGKSHGYVIALTVTKEHVYVFEAWGPADLLAADRAKMDAAIKSLKVSWWDERLPADNE
jgi:hypothetical protein